jgi:hypothetical protein
MEIEPNAKCSLCNFKHDVIIMNFPFCTLHATEALKFVMYGD